VLVVLVVLEFVRQIQMLMVVVMLGRLAEVLFLELVELQAQEELAVEVMFMQTVLQLPQAQAEQVMAQLVLLVAQMEEVVVQEHFTMAVLVVVAVQDTEDLVQVGCKIIGLISLRGAASALRLNN